jgi:AcrR family transcriptional regulator
VKKADLVKKAEGSRARDNQSRNSKATKARILEAASDAFATLGYERAAVRTIAQMTNIHPSMLMRYYTNQATRQWHLQPIENTSARTVSKGPVCSLLKR